MHQLKKSDCGLIEGKLVNTSQRVPTKLSAWFFTPVRHTCQFTLGVEGTAGWRVNFFIYDNHESRALDAGL